MSIYARFSVFLGLLLLGAAAPHGLQAQQQMAVNDAKLTQYVKAFTSCETFSDLTVPSTMMRQPMVSVSPCATTFPTMDGSVVDRSIDHGSVTALTCCGSALTSK